MNTNEIYNENCLTTLGRVPKGLIKCCVTSPPYYGLRDYGNDEQIGLEETPELYIKNLVAVFHLLKEKMADNGTLWLNIGDSYAAYWGQKYGQGQGLSKSRENKGSAPPAKKSPNFSKSKRMEIGEGRWGGGNLPAYKDIKPKDLFGIPWMLAFALRADGWYLRQDIIWSKPNPMPESVTDRCTKSHEYIFLLSKSQRYYYNAEAIKEPVITHDKNIRDRETTKLNNVPGRKRMEGLTTNSYEKANKRSVWTVTTKPFSEAHFATFPPDLIVPCIKAGSGENDVIYDPFMGAGTTAMVSLKLNRRFIGSEINADYCEIARKRIHPLLHNLFTV